jgi:hypothetical protein
MNTASKVAAGLAAAVVFASGGIAGSVLSTESTTAETTTTVEPFCGESVVPTDPKLCASRGFILYGSLYNIQGAGQFCKWKAANPGEWTRIKAYINTRTTAQVTTWFGASLRDQVQAYLAADGPTTTMPANNTPNACKTPLSPPTDLQTTTTG